MINSAVSVKMSNFNKDQDLLLKEYKDYNSSLLYEGANGQVFKIWDGNNNVVVKKVLKSQQWQSDEDYERSTRREYLNALKSKNKNIIDILGLYLDKETNSWCMIIPYYAKGDLLDYFCELRRQNIKLSSDLNDSVFKQILKGVNFLHKKNIVHRDLKPENFMIDDNGVVKISDFGYSLNLDTDLENYWQEVVKYPRFIKQGTVSFKAPELFELGRQEPIDVDECKKIDFKKLDCWALGIVYFQLTLMSTPWPEADAKSERGRIYSKYASVVPFDEGSLKSLVDQLEDKHLSFRSNPALSCFQKLHYDSRYAIFKLLSPTPSFRYDVESVLLSTWISQVYADPKDLVKLMH